MTIGPFDNPYFAELAHHVSVASVEMRHDVITSYFRPVGRERGRGLRELLATGIEGLITYGQNTDLALLDELELPCVLLWNHPPHTDRRIVGIDLIPGCVEAADHLIDAGRRKIILVSHITEGSDEARVSAVARRLAERGCEISPDRYVPAMPTLAGGRDVVERILSTGTEVDAIFCYNDALAIGVLGGLAEHGVSVPYQCAVIGCNDLSMAEMVTPRLSSVSTDLPGLAQTAVARLVSEIGGSKPEEPLFLTSRLVVRESSDSGLAELRDRHTLPAWRIGGVVHDFNNTLSVLLGTSELLAARLPREGVEADLLDRTITSIRRAAVLTSHLRSGDAATSPKEVLDLNSLVIELLDDLQLVLGSAYDLEYFSVFAVDDEEALVFAQRDLLASTLVNLALNTRNASPAGTVTIRLDHADAEEYRASYEHSIAPSIAANATFVRVDFSDNGPGVAPEIQRRVFEPFYTQSKGGTGLGLAMSRASIRACGGNLVLLNAAQGATFSLYLPESSRDSELHVSPRTHPSELAHLVQRRGGLEVAIVDDDPLVLATLEDLLVEAGCRVEAFSRAEPAIEALAAGQAFDLLITDLFLPGLSGLAVGGHFRAHQPPMPVIYITGFADVFLSELDLVEGTLLLEKPLARDDIEQILRFARDFADRVAGQGGGAEG